MLVKGKRVRVRKEKVAYQVIAWFSFIKVIVGRSRDTTNYCYEEHLSLPEWYIFTSYLQEFQRHSMYS